MREPADDATLDPAHARRALAGAHGPATLRAALERLPPSERDGWVDRVLGVEDVPEDGPELPRGCVPYLPCPVDLVLAMLDAARVGEGDVLVDLGSGLGRVSTLTHLITGASAIGLEIQPALVGAARRLAAALGTPRVVTIEGDAAELVGAVPTGTVFFLYCPFGAERLERVLDQLEELARARPLRVACVQMPTLARPWLSLASAPHPELAVYVTTRHRDESAD